MGHSEHQGVNGREVCKEKLSGFCVVATVNWPRRMEQFGGRMIGKPRVNCSL